MTLNGAVVGVKRGMRKISQGVRRAVSSYPESTQVDRQRFRLPRTLSGGKERFIPLFLLILPRM